MKIAKYILYILTALLIFSCVDNPTGFFYSLEKESEIDDGSLNNNITVGSMVKNNDYYFIGSGKFRYRLAGDSTDGSGWTVDAPEDYEEYFIQNLIKLDDVYAIFYSLDQFSFKIFRADTSGISTATAGSETINWTEITLTDLADGEHPVDFQISSGRVFIYTSTADYKYSVYSTDSASLTAGTTLTPEPNISGITGGGTFDVDWDESNYWLISGNRLFSGTLGSMAENIAAASASEDLTGMGYGGVVCNGTDVYLSTKEGIVLKYDGSPWAVTTEGLEAPLYDFLKVEDFLLLASSQGYYEKDLGTADSDFVSPESVETTLTDRVQYSSIDLSKSALTGFFYDSAIDEKSVFALGYNSGLWNNSLENSLRSWNIE